MSRTRRPASRPVVVVTRDEGQGGPLGRALSARGFEVFSLPTVASEPPSDPAPLDAAIGRLAAFDWVVFTSARGVDAACGRPAWGGSWRSAARTPRVAAVGLATAERLAAYGLTADLVPAEAGTPGLLGALAAAHGGRLQGLSVLWPRSEIAGRELADGLTAGGALLVDPVAYRTVPATAEAIRAFRDELERGRIDAIAFLSSSAAAGLAAALGAEDLGVLAGRTLVASLGPSTSEALRSLGAPPDLEAEVRSREGLADALATRLFVPEGVRR